MAFDPSLLTRLSGPLSVIYPPEGQAQYWAYRTAEGLDAVMVDGFFPAPVVPGDIVWVFLSSDAEQIILGVKEVT